MRFSRIYVSRYGPLSVDIPIEDDVQVIYGPNESGKTLLVESLLLMLTGDETVAEARVDETPEGFLVFEDDSEEIKLDSSQTLIDWYKTEIDQEIRPDEFRNVFVIRDADLDISDEDRFYQRVTDRFVGIRTSDIEVVHGALIDKGRLTDKRLNISSDQAYDYAGKQLKDAKDLRGETSEYLDEADEEGYPELEARLYRVKAERDRFEAEVDALEQAEKQQELHRLQVFADDLESNIEEVGDRPDEDRLDQISADLDGFQDDAVAESELDDRKDRYAAVAKWSIVGAVIAFIAQILLNAPTIVTVVPALLALLAGIALWQYRRTSQQLVSIESEREALVAAGQRLGLEVDDVGTLRVEVSILIEEHDSLSDDITGAIAVLRERLDISEKDPESVLQAARERLEKRAREFDFEIDREFSESALKEAHDSLKDKENELEEIQEAIRDHERTMKRFAERAQGLRFETFVGEPLDLNITNLDALQQLQTRLTEFIRAINSDADRSRVAIEIFDEMATAENEKVRELFGESSGASELFGRITGDRYTAVEWEHTAGELSVKRETGERFTPEELSKGTRDQLYLSIRVSLGRQLLEGRDGFFIMDDAFLTADPERLRRQAEVLSELAEAGWQTVYLTAEPVAEEIIQDVTGAAVTELEQLR